MVYTSSAAGEPLRAYAVLLLGGGEQGIARIDAFFDPRLFARFGVPEELAG